MNAYHWINRYITPSRIDSYIYHRDTENNTTQDFINNLLKLDTRFAINMKAGNVVHSYIEHANYETVPIHFVKDGWTVQTSPYLDCQIALPSVREMKISKEYKQYNMFGKVDCIDGIVVHDIKTTRQIKLEKYAESMQWKLYLWMTGLSIFEYNIFEIKIEEWKKSIMINKYKELKLYRYSNMEQDIFHMLDEYIGYLYQIKEQIQDTARLNNIVLKL
jgi:hypothetical protein